MASFDIDIEWGGKWGAGERRHVRPFVETAVGIAADAADDFGLVPVLPKTARIWKCSPIYPDAGETDSATAFDINIPKTHTRHRKVGNIANNLVMVAFHELGHTIRKETNDRMDLLECAATEGVVCELEDLLGISIFNEDEVVLNALVLPPLDPKMLARVTAAFMEDARSQQELGFDPSVPDEYHKKWFEQAPLHTPLPVGVILGIHHVRANLMAGIPLEQQIHLPAEEIIRLDHAA
jgi:hypothetical protein